MDKFSSPIPPSSASDDIPEGLRAAMRATHMVPLWESPTAHKDDRPRERPYCWPWRDTQPIMEATATLRSPAIVERRVVSLVNPKSTSRDDEATCGAISATLQMMLPGERARPHRHSMNALRFVLEGKDAATIVDGQKCAMEPGDLIITPAWCWHEHVSNGQVPTIWFDVLDVALHLFLGTEAFEPGPGPETFPPPKGDAFSVPGLIPAGIEHKANHSPRFRYAWRDVAEALAGVPELPDGSRRVRYVDPLTGGPVMPLLDCEVLALAPGRATQPTQSSASTVCCVAAGEGGSEIDGETIRWAHNDVFTLPAGARATHRADQGGARIFMVSNRPVYARLGLLDEGRSE